MAIAGRGGAILLDKDGTLLENVPYNVDPARIRLADTVGDALRRLSRLGLPLAVVSNQPGVALGRFDERALDAVRQALGELFARHGATLSGF
ncbi:MAG: HAD family hydrolase, partial [Cupriavidus sp.]|nr:HAD family hydrolase [Cupriavidus sp.]